MPGRPVGLVEMGALNVQADLSVMMSQFTEVEFPFVHVIVLWCNQQLRAYFFFFS